MKLTSFTRNFICLHGDGIVPISTQFHFFTLEWIKWTCVNWVYLGEVWVEWRVLLKDGEFFESGYQLLKNVSAPSEPHFLFFIFLFIERTKARFEDRCCMLQHIRCSEWKETDCDNWANEQSTVYLRQYSFFYCFTAVIKQYAIYMSRVMCYTDVHCRWDGRSDSETINWMMLILRVWVIYCGQRNWKSL